MVAMPLPIAAVVACLAAFHVAAAAPSAAPRADAAALTDAVNAVADARSLSAFHEALASEPHVAGTPGDARQVERLTKAFREMGLEVEVHRILRTECVLHDRFEDFDGERTQTDPVRWRQTEHVGASSTRPGASATASRDWTCNRHSGSDTGPPQRSS